MTRPVVRCRCGHRVLAKEVLRTDLYERPSGREYVYVKFRCKRCKRLGETFVSENRWDWRIFETSRNEMSEAESEVFADQSPISSEDILTFHRQLEAVESAGELTGEIAAPSPEGGSENNNPTRLRRDFKGEAKADPKARPSETGTVEGNSRDESTRGRPPRDN